MKAIHKFFPELSLSKLKSHTRSVFMLLGLIVSVYACDDEESQPELNSLPDIGSLCASGCDMELEPELEPDMMRLPQCNDDLDNDGDGLVDGFDRGCTSLDDDDERDPETIPACQDGLDNDGDGLIDYPQDPECGSSNDLYEARPEPVVPECSDGIDNDEDGNIDYPVDRGCASSDDLFEDGDPPTIPQCADERDNDADDLVDIADPGCQDEGDMLELNGPAEERPRCSDGIDNDGDGFIDFPRDPGCTRASDNDEITLPFATECYDDEDNDGDGLIDFPFDPGCSGVGDEDESDRLIIAPQCADEVDNDNDGSIDYPDDNGCFSAGDDSERGACGLSFESGSLQNGVVVRGVLSQGVAAASGSCGGAGGREIAFRYTVRRRLQALIITTDFPENEIESVLYVRRICGDPSSEVFCSQEAVDGFPSQTIRVEEPELGEYFIFLDSASNASGDFAIRLDEELIAECRNGIDDDFNGLTDFPYDPGCNDPFDRSERATLEPPTCFDEIDNDQDALTDYPNDLGCLYAGDDSEEDICGQGVPMDFFPTGVGSVIGNTATGGSNRFYGSCGGENIREQVYLYQQPFSAKVTFSVNHPETEQDTLIHLRRGQCTRDSGNQNNNEEDRNWFNEVGCSSRSGNQGKATLVIESMPPGTYYIFVDHPSGQGGPFKLSVDFERLPPSCQNGLDDDGDGFSDGEDLGCSSRQDDVEFDDLEIDEMTVLPACFDQIDNDNDGLIDYPLDPGCELKLDQDESDPERAPACSNGRDDDRDELIDLDDPGCYAAADQVEQDERPIAQCANNYDDDGDGLIDFPNDPDCVVLGDLSEYDDERSVECSDEIDNDEDGLIDYPYEPGCTSAADYSEDNSDPLPACGNLLDDDGDGLIDFPEEIGCINAADTSEEDPELIPACANEIDDDRDRKIDWPEDPQCQSASDTSERR
ncbi:MAG: hypothetical protein CMH49_02410 [Myxococcales bacterium]|nr:hypothetical protein [Myxococcales bacterium]